MFNMPPPKKTHTEQPSIALFVGKSTPDEEPTPVDDTAPVELTIATQVAHLACLVWRDEARVCVAHAN